MKPAPILLTLAVAFGLSQPLAAQNLETQRPAIRSALQAAEQGKLDDIQATALRQHPLYPWLQYAQLKHDIDTLEQPRAAAFLKQYNGQPVAEAFRSIWLAALARHQDWSTLLAYWKPSSSTALVCAQLNARQATGKADAQWQSEVQTLWAEAGKSLPDACDPVFAALEARGGMTDSLRWQRLLAAADAGQPAIMRRAAKGLSANDLALANDYVRYLSQPDANVGNWPKNERSRQIATDALAQLAKSQPDTAEQLLPAVSSTLGLNDNQRAQVLYQIALWTVASYLPDSARRLAAVPAAAYDERLHEWRAREAMARGDWPAALTAIQNMPAEQREQSRWQYFQARLLEKTGAADAARTLYQQAAQNADFHGFLAADRLQQPYALCPLAAPDDAKTKASLSRDPALQRAIELSKLERPGWAALEWKDALSRYNDEQRRIAVEIASDNGWFDRAVFGLGKQPEELRMYSLRFPLHHDATIRREASRNALDPAWIAAEIRAESVFNPKARSPANAMGLMQVLPSTGAGVAKQIGLAGYGGAASLYDPDTNIAIGTAYLRQLLDKYQGQPYVTIAAYNAGPVPTARWQSQRPNFDPDFWIETISYKETREYVARVLAFSVIYDWRLNGKAVPLSDRINGKLEAPRKAFACPAP